MAVTATPIFVQSVRTEIVQISTANTNRDGTGTLSSAVNAGSNGSTVRRIDITATGTTTAGVVRAFLYDGSAYRLWREVLVQAITPSATIAAFMASIDCSSRDSALVLASSRSLKFSTHNAEGFNIAVVLGDY